MRNAGKNATAVKLNVARRRGGRTSNRQASRREGQSEIGEWGERESHQQDGWAIIQDAAIGFFREISERCAKLYFLFVVVHESFAADLPS